MTTETAKLCARILELDEAATPGDVDKAIALEETLRAEFRTLAPALAREYLRVEQVHDKYLREANSENERLHNELRKLEQKLGKIGEIAERMDCTCGAEASDSDHSYEICGCDQHDILKAIRGEP